MPINYVIGDATNPSSSGRRIITHCCNDAGYWNAGFVRALSARYHQPERDYRRWSKTNRPIPFALGEVQFIKVLPGLCVANIIGQHGIKSHANPKPIDYRALRAGLSKVCELAISHNATVHMPRMGAGLAGGNWDLISAIIDEELCQNSIEVTVYDLPAPSETNRF